MIIAPTPLRRCAALSLVLAVLQPAAHAQGFQDPAAIDRDVAAFTGQPIGAPGGAARPVDRRLRLANCAAPLALSWRGDAHASILVECPDQAGWHIFVATSAPASTTAARQAPATR